MLNFGSRRIFLCRQAVDMRKSYDSLSDLVRTNVGMDPFSGDVYIFLGKDRTRAKILVWEQSGFWLCCKRLETARFAFPQPGSTANSPTLSMTAGQVMTMLEQVIPRALRYQRLATTPH